MINLPDVSVKKILYATDLSQSARYAFAYAVSLADRYKADLAILYVMEENPTLDERVVGYVSAEKWDEIKQKHMDEARMSLIGKKRDHVAIREVLTRFAEKTAAQITDQDMSFDEIIMDRGNPVERILATAGQINADVIVMGTHGVSSLADTMLGSTAQRVMRRAKIPVLVVRLPED